MWQATRRFFKDSETIFWARLQALIGFIVFVLTFVDPSLVTALIKPEWVPYFLLANGIAAEYLRRRRADDL